MYRPNLQSVALAVPEVIVIAVLGWGCDPQQLGGPGQWPVWPVIKTALTIHIMQHYLSDILRCVAVCNGYYYKSS